jgi:acyl carrier protein
MEERIKKILKKVLNNSDMKIDNNVEFRQYGVDSLALTELLISLEDEFNIQIDDSDQEKLISVDSTAEFIKSCI